MKKKYYLIAVYFLITIVFVSCNKNDIDGGTIIDPGQVDNPINNFVWDGMNSWYNWQPDVPNLADTKNDVLEDYYTYLNGFTDPEVLFESLLYDKGNTDRFSWFIEDYIEQEKQFQGISKSLGFRRSVPIQISSGAIIIYVQHVTTNSPSSDAGIKRGDIINAIDGEEINENNYVSVINKLYSNETVILSFVSENNGELTPIEDKTITPVELTDNPVHVTNVFNDIDGKKVGYLLYNGFRTSFNDELNAAFALFKGEGINELVLDLRINGGGSVETTAYLASMIYQNAGTDVFAELNFNAKHDNQNGTYNFENTLNIYDVSFNKTGEESINRLNTINRLYVLASGSTASASEMIISGLKPFMNVIVIGDTTFGKNVGSITLYDSPSTEYTSKTSVNPDHLNAMQPIVFQIFNKNGESDYTQGFAPDIEILEWQFWNEILAFGDENEVVLKTALDDIRGLTSKIESTAKFRSINVPDANLFEPKFEKEMYINGNFFDK